MRISDWSSDVCSSDLIRRAGRIGEHGALEIVCGEAVADGEGEEVDYFVRVRTDEMRAKDSPAAFLHQRLIAIHRRSEERRVGKECSVRVDLGGRRIIKKKTAKTTIKKQTIIDH